MRYTLVVAFVCLMATAYAAQWELVADSVVSVGIGTSLHDDRIVISGGQDGVGAMLLRSEDAGATWNELSHSGEMYFMGVSLNGDGNSTGVTGGLGMFKIFRGLSYTQDGETFSPAPEPVMASAFQSFKATNESLYAVGYEAFTMTGEDFDGVVRTTDNGATIEHLPWNVNDYVRYGDFPSSDIWYLSGGSFPVSSLGGKVYGNRIGRDGLHLNNRVTLKAKGTHSVRIKEEPKLEMSGYTGVIAKTVDGGQTFTVVFSEDSDFYFNGISCPSVDVCYAVAEGSELSHILASKDGGETWEVQWTSDFPAGLFDVKFVSETHGYAVGGAFRDRTFDSLTLSTTDGGATWVAEVGAFPGHYFNAIDCDELDHCSATSFARSGGSSVFLLS